MSGPLWNRRSCFAVCVTAPSTVSSFKITPLVTLFSFISLPRPIIYSNRHCRLCSCVLHDYGVEQLPQPLLRSSLLPFSLSIMCPVGVCVSSVLLVQFPLCRPPGGGGQTEADGERDHKLLRGCSEAVPSRRGRGYARHVVCLHPPLGLWQEYSRLLLPSPEGYWEGEFNNGSISRAFAAQLFLIVQTDASIVLTPSSTSPGLA